MADDDAFISVFNNEDAFLTGDLRYYFTADLCDSTGAGIGQALLTLTVPEPAMAWGLTSLALLWWRRRFVA